MWLHTGSSEFHPTISHLIGISQSLQNHNKMYIYFLVPADYYGSCLDFTWVSKIFTFFQCQWDFLLKNNYQILVKGLLLEKVNHHKVSKTVEKEKPDNDYGEKPYGQRHTDEMQAQWY